MGRQDSDLSPEGLWGLKSYRVGVGDRHESGGKTMKTNIDTHCNTQVGTG